MSNLQWSLATILAAMLVFGIVAVVVGPSDLQSDSQSAEQPYES